MGKNEKIQVHRMDDWFSGVYIKPFGAKSAVAPEYEISRPHRHDFYYCVVLEKGKMELEVDFERIELTDHSLFLSYPGQIHSIRAAQMDEGWFLAFDPSLLDENLKNILDGCLSEIILVPLLAEHSGTFSSYISHLYTVYKDTEQLFRQTITQAMVTALVYQLAAAYMATEQFSLIRHTPRSIEITKIFKQILRRDYKSLKRPSEYASKIHITVSYLNDTVRSVTGFPVTYHIQQQLMREAQRLLYYSDLSVKEIADTLGYDDVAYFNRLFSKVKGLAPGAFRKQRETAV